MRRYAAVTWLCLSVSAAGTARAGSVSLSGRDMLCEASLKSAQETLTEVVGRAEEASGPLDKARLQRSHADWIRQRGTTCDLLSAGGVDMSCCLERETEKRIVDLSLFLAQLRPVAYHTWGRGVPIPEAEELNRYLLGRSPRFATPSLPDQLLRIGDAQYLLAYSAAPAGEQRIEYVNLRRGATTRLKEAAAQLTRVVRDKRDGKHVLVRCATVDRRIRWTEYYLIRLAGEGGELKAVDTRLALFQEDAGSGRCDDHSVTFLKLEKAVVATRVEYVDANRDGHEDIVFELEEIECRTQATRSYRMTYLAGEEGFVRTGE